MPAASPATSPATPPVTSAIIIRTKGTVEVSLAGERREGLWRIVGSGFPLGEGDRVRTGRDSWAEIKLLRGLAPVGWIRLEPGAEFLLEAIREPTPASCVATSSPISATHAAPSEAAVTVPGAVFKTRLFLGRIYVKILRQLAPILSPAIEFEVATDAATVGVRGTLFSVCVSPSGITDVSVREGLVEVAAQGRSVFLGTGQEITVHPGMPPELPGPMSPEERKQWQGAEKWLDEIEGKFEEGAEVGGYGSPNGSADAGVGAGVDHVGINDVKQDPGAVAGKVSGKGSVKGERGRGDETKGG